MMDFSKFSDDNFDMKDWINNALRVQKDTKVTVDAHTSNLVMKLQLFIQEVSKSLEETSEVALNNMPRVLREVETIRSETSLLKSQMMMVKDDIKKVEENTAQSMKKLVEIDTVKGRMQNACNALKEADNWSTLSSEVNELFTAGKMDLVAEKLIGMQKSLVVLKDVPDFTERYRILENLKNKLEALLSPKIVQTFNNHDLENAKYYVKIFSDLDRLSQLQTYYSNCHKSSLTRTWNEIRDDPNNLITSWLPTYYDHLLALWHREVSWCGQVFPEPVQALCSLLAQTLASLHPSIQGCIQDALNDEENSLQLLIELQSITKRFVQGLENAVQAYLSASSQPSQDESMMKLIHIVKNPFQIHLLRYSNLQQISLMAVIDSIPKDTTDIPETVQNMTNSISEIFRGAEDALESCIQFTSGYGAAGLADALQIYFSAYLGRLDVMLNDMRKSCHLDNDWPIKDDDSANQWTNFQYGFKIIEMCGSLILKMEGFCCHMYTQLKTIFKTIISDQKNDSSGNYLKFSRPMEWDKLIELHEKISEYGVDTILPSTQDNVAKLNEHAHKFAFDVIFIHLRRQLNALPKFEIWCESLQEALDGELPTFSLSPLGYITYVGDSLLMLPQQLEPYFVQENEYLISALKAGKIPYQDDKQNQVGAQYDHNWLESYALGVITVFTENILKIQVISAHSTRQLLADIEYFCNILAALEIQPSFELKVIKDLLEVDTKDFKEKVHEIKAESGIAKSIMKMRNIHI